MRLDLILRGRSNGILKESRLSGNTKIGIISDDGSPQRTPVELGYSGFKAVG